MVEFEADGEPGRVAVEDRDRLRPAISSGHQIDVLYDPADPHQIEPAEIGNSAGTWLIVGLVIVMLAVMI